MSRSATSTPRDPLRTFQFRVAVEDPRDGSFTWVAGVRKVSGLTASISAFEVWEGGNNLHRYAQPDKVTWEAVTLEQGLCLDDTFELWAKSVLDFSRTGTAPSVRLKRNVTIDVWDPLNHSSSRTAEPVGIRRKRFTLVNAWPSRFVALPGLDAMTSEVGLVTLELQHEGFREQTDQPTDASLPPLQGYSLTNS